MVENIALILLVIRLISVAFVITVLRKQLQLFRINVNSELSDTRKVMFLLCVVFLGGAMLPIITDFYYAFLTDGNGRFNILVWYAISNALGALAASILLWNIYRIAYTELDEKQIEADKKE